MNVTNRIWIYPLKLRFHVRYIPGWWVIYDLSKAGIMPSNWNSKNGRHFILKGTNRMGQHSIDFVKGWVRTSLIDYPGKIATVLYTEGCNLRCPICHNPELITYPERYESIDLSEILTYLKDREDMVDGVVISGGEPLLRPETMDLLEQFRSLKIAIKLDTNGCFPDRLAEILSHKLVDMVAMDVKGSKSLYPLVSGVKDFDVSKIDQSLTLLKQSSVDYEIRTTVIPQVIDLKAVTDIVGWIGPVRHYVLQQFRPVMTLDARYRYLEPLPDAQLNAMAEIARKVISDVSVRGLAF